MISQIVSAVSRRSLVAVAVLGSFVLSGCNGVGDKDALLARIDGEKVFQEDYELLLKMDGPFHFEKNEVLYENLYSKAALTAKAIAEMPELEKAWEEQYKDLDPRILTIAYQRFYAMECLTYSDSELRQFYNENHHLFPEDSSNNFYAVRGLVAKRLYLAKHPKEVDEFLQKELSDRAEAKDSAMAKERFADLYQQNLPNMLSANVLEKQNVVINPLPEVDAKSFYERHRDMFMTVPGYRLYHIQSENAETLDSLFAVAPTLEQFKQVAAKISVNAETKKDSGLVGYVKKDFALPYGIGMVEGLSSELEGKDAGFVTKTLAGQGKSFHRFYLEALVPAQQKSFDRAEADVKSAIASGEAIEVDSSYVLISRAGQPLFTEGDLIRFNKKFSHMRLNVRNHERLIKMIAETFAYAHAAEEAKVKHSWEYRALVRMARWDYICDTYMERKRGSYLVPDDSLKSLYDRVGSPIHVGYDYEKAIEDLRLVNSIPANLYRHEYLFGYRLLYKDRTYDQSIPAIYAKREKEYNKLYRQRVAADAYESASVHLYNSDVPEYEPRRSLDVLMARGDSLLNAGNRTSAFYVYRSIMYAFAENDSVFEKVAYIMAQIQGDNEEFLDAEAEYYAFYRMWPNSENAEKAMFSRGFMLNENLQMNEPALEVLEEFTQKYPKSELKESADWLIQNIKSGGKLADDLMEKISSEE